MSDRDTVITIRGQLKYQGVVYKNGATLLVSASSAFHFQKRNRAIIQTAKVEKYGAGFEGGAHKSLCELPTAGASTGE